MLTILSAAAPSAAQVQSAKQATCVTAMNDAAAKVVKAQMGAAQKCLKAASSGTGRGRTSDGTRASG